MEKHIVADFDFNIPEDRLLKKLRLDESGEQDDIEKALQMLSAALAVARPKYLYALASIEKKDDDGVIIDGKKIESLLVRQNLDEIHKVIPYVATCGREVEEWSKKYTDILENYWADEIKNMLLQKAVSEMHKTVKKKYFAAGNMSFMSPGSLVEWPLGGQRVLFEIIGDVADDVGVSLTESCLMLPAKSVSGFFFSSASHYENCRLCPIIKCPSRRARYEKN